MVEGVGGTFDWFWPMFTIVPVWQPKTHSFTQGSRNNGWRAYWSRSSETESSAVLSSDRDPVKKYPSHGRAFYGWIPGQPLSTIVVTFPFMTSTCFLSPVNGIPGGGDPGDFDAAAKPKAVGEAKGASGEARIHHLCEERKVLTLCSSHLNPS